MRTSEAESDFGSDQADSVHELGESHPVAVSQFEHLVESVRVDVLAVSEQIGLAFLGLIMI